MHPEQAIPRDRLLGLIALIAITVLVLSVVTLGGLRRPVSGVEDHSAPPSPQHSRHATHRAP